MAQVWQMTHIVGGSINSKNLTRSGSMIVKKGWVHDLEKTSP